MILGIIGASEHKELCWHTCNFPDQIPLTSSFCSQQASSLDRGLHTTFSNAKIQAWVFVVADSSLMKLGDNFFSESDLSPKTSLVPRLSPESLGTRLFQNHIYLSTIVNRINVKQSKDLLQTMIPA